MAGARDVTMDDQTERIVIAVCVGAGCMLLFFIVVMTVILCRTRCCRHRHNSDSFDTSVCIDIDRYLSHALS